MTLPRRRLLTGAGSGLAALWLAGCDKVTEDPHVVKALASAEVLNRRVQRLLGRGALAREFSRADITPNFKANGTVNPPDADYQAMAAQGFADWKLVVDGLVQRPLALTLAELRALPARTQITRHDCVEGWSCIGEWTGAKFAAVMDLAGLKPSAKHIVLHCADTLGGAKYYETLDVFDVRHPQTILAYAMNGAPLTVAHGAPLRLRAERYLGYKQAKYVMRLEAVDRFDHIGGGQGGYWEDQGYDRYGGI
ncbi:MAG TPA: molybdopterin-dependent oxidoreductase [Caulobacteraceae bacterium]|jgi:DMSO/TMAO reductase YedYZ molybdopterin-dependent catalytic subunit|nr:molybdopterin-dependent oxidoreductase [Caulobacteraceae bacterium]